MMLIHHVSIVWLLLMLFVVVLTISITVTAIESNTIEMDDTSIGTFISGNVPMNSTGTNGTSNNNKVPSFQYRYQNTTARIRFQSTSLQTLSSFQFLGYTFTRSATATTTTNTTTSYTNGYEYIWHGTIAQTSSTTTNVTTTTTTTTTNTLITPVTVGSCIFVYNTQKNTLMGLITTPTTSYEIIQRPNDITTTTQDVPEEAETSLTSSSSFSVGRYEIRWTKWNEFPLEEDDELEEEIENEIETETETENNVVDNVKEFLLELRNRTKDSDFRQRQRRQQQQQQLRIKKKQQQHQYIQLPIPTTRTQTNHTNEDTFQTTKKVVDEEKEKQMMNHDTKPTTTTISMSGLLWSRTATQQQQGTITSLSNQQYPFSNTNFDNSNPIHDIDNNINNNENNKNDHLDAKRITTRRRKTQTQTTTTTTASSTAFPIVDVLVVVTNRAMCEYAGLNIGCKQTVNVVELMTNKMGLLEATTNTVFTNSKIPGGIRLIGPYFLPSEVTNDYTTTTESLANIRQNNDIQTVRASTGADLVSVIVGSTSSFCGRGVVGGIYNVVNHECFGQHSFQHEIGHNLGAYHDRSSCSNQHTYAHGYQHESEFRTIMAYDCRNGSPCPRILYYSNPNIWYNGIRLGSYTENNSRMITETISSTAESNGRQPPPTPIPPTRTPPKPVASPIKQPSPVISVATKPVAKPVAKPVTKPVAKPIKKPPTTVGSLSCPILDISITKCLDTETYMHVNFFFTLLCYSVCVPNDQMNRTKLFGKEMECGPCT